MSAYYDLYQTPNPSPEDGEEKLLHARILPKGTIPADKFREPCHSRWHVAGYNGWVAQLAGRRMDSWSGRIGILFVVIEVRQGRGE